MNLLKYSKYMYLGLLSVAIASPLSAYAKTTDPEAEAAPESLVTERRASIYFANQGGIKNWNAIDDETIQIQARNNQWFQAEIFSYCDGLNFANTIGFVTEHNGELNKYSSIMLRGQECHFRSFKRIDLGADTLSSESSTDTENNAEATEEVSAK